VSSLELFRRASYVFLKLKQLGAKGVFMICGNSLSIVGSERPLGNPVNDNEAKS